MHKLDTPKQLVNEDGHPSYGVFKHSVATINGRETDHRTPMGKPANSLAKFFEYKQFQYFGVIHEDYLIGCALADTSWLGIAFFYIFTPSTGELESYTWRSPLGMHINMSDSPVKGCSHFKQKKVRIEMGYRQRANGLEKTLAVTLPDLTLDLVMHEEANYEPMSLCTRTGINGWVYANKVAGVKVSGTLRRGSETQEIDAFGHHDFSAGYMRRQTFWNWACFSGDVNGQHVGLNISCGVNETSYSENCLWLNNLCIPLGNVAFHYDRDRLLQPWTITSSNQKVKLVFKPLGQHKEQLNLGLFASNFHQLFGYFTGSIELDDGQRIQIDRLHGFVEEQYAKW